MINNDLVWTRCDAAMPDPSQECYWHRYCGLTVTDTWTGVAQGDADHHIALWDYEWAPFKGVKQVIVMRKDLNMRKGKMVAQGAHASMKDLVGRYWSGQLRNAPMDDASILWYGGTFRKICCYVNSEAELDDLYVRAIRAGTRAHMIIDNGATEFNGVKTKTCLAIGPHFDDAFAGLTDTLPLL